MNNVTVLIPIFNGAKTIVGVLERLTMQRLGSPLKILIYDNGSTDGTVGLLSELCATGYFMNRSSQDRTSLDIHFFRGIHDNSLTGYQNAQKVRKQLSAMSKTPYLFFLDADVILPPASIFLSLDELKEDIGCVGIKYEADCVPGHVMLGATLWKKEVFDKIPVYDTEAVKKGCDCLHCVRSLTEIGLKSVFHPNLMAYHCKYF